MKAIRRDAPVTTDFHVRRRKYNELILLIRQHEWLELDAISDAVWRACERDVTVGEIVETVAQEQSLPLGEALAATVVTLEQLAAIGFVSYETLPVNS